MIIGLTGHKGSGKNLAADAICKSLPSFKQDAFARPLKEACSVIFGLSDVEMNDPEIKEVPLTRYPFESPREIMQKLGTEAVRAHWKDAWVEALIRRVRGLGDCVVTDCRFPNEVQALQNLGGHIIRIVRPAAEPTTDRDRDLHPSETVQDALTVDKTVINDGSADLLAARVLAAVYELMEGK
jgi:hypothetical protein